jgi:hypothetical protein
VHLYKLLEVMFTSVYTDPNRSLSAQRFSERTVQGNAVNIQTPALWNLIASITTVRLPVFRPRKLFRYQKVVAYSEKVPTNFILVYIDPSKLLILIQNLLLAPNSVIYCERFFMSFDLMKYNYMSPRNRTLLKKIINQVTVKRPVF